MLENQLSFFPENVLFTGDISTEFEALKSSIIPHCRAAAEITLQMSLLDPKFTSSQAIGTYLHDNLVLRLHECFACKEAFLRSYYSRQRFLVAYTSQSNIQYVLPIHRCNDNTYLPKGGEALKKQIKNAMCQLNLIRSTPLGLFIGIIYHETNGLIEVFLGHLRWKQSARKWDSTNLHTLFSKSWDTVDRSRLPNHECEEIKEPEVKFKKR